MANRDIKALHPLLLNKIAEFDKQMKAADISYVICCTYRSNAEQEELYTHGRTAKGGIVTNARAGQSAHNTTLNGKPAACAFDIAIFTNGKYAPDNHINWFTAGKIGMGLGLEWLGISKTFRESPHFQLPNWRQYVSE